MRKFGSLALRVDGSPQPLMAYGMPRSDVFTVLHPAIDSADSAPLTSDPDSPSDPQLLSFRSGFWGLAHIGPSEPGSDCRLELRAELEGGGTALTELGRLEIGALPAEPAAPEAPEPAAGPLVAICMASHEPPPALLRLQLDSIRAQTHRNWICVISDDCSGPTGFAELKRAVGGDPRFLVSRSPRRLGFYRNFERALALAPAAADYVALADQDDRWRPEKLETLLGAIGDARLVYSDQRIVSPEGELLAETYWSRRDPNHDSLSRCWWPTRHRRRLALPARPARLRAALPAAAVHALPRSLDRALCGLAGRDRLRRAAALRLRAAQGRRAGPRGRQPHADAATTGRRSCARIRASACAAGACTTSWTAAG